MSQAVKGGSLTREEREIVKGLLERGWRNQDIQAVVNTGRSVTANSARITEVKKNQKQKAAPGDAIDFYLLRKKSFDSRTGLNLYDDERLIRSREAMSLAVHVYNSASLRFKTEVFSVLANIAWTYLLHEYYTRKGFHIFDKAGRSWLLSQMIDRADCPLSSGVRNNLRSLKEIRDQVEHLLLGRGDLKWYPLFQACCLNFDKALCDLFGEKLTLSDDLSLALQFARLDFDQLTTLNKHQIPADIEALDARLNRDLSHEQLNDIEYQFRVVYTLDATSKAKAHFEFVRPDSVEGKEIRNVLVQYKTADHLYPHKPARVAALVRQRTGTRFDVSHHANAWRFYKARPRKGAKDPSQTNKDFCIYHEAHRDYTYSDRWVDMLCSDVSDPAKFAKIKAMKS